MKNQTKKIIFLVHKKPLNAACYECCCLICLILMFFVFCWGGAGLRGRRAWGPFPEGPALKRPHQSGPVLSLTLPARPGKQEQGCGSWPPGSWTEWGSPAVAGLGPRQEVTHRPHLSRCHQEGAPGAVRGELAGLASQSPPAPGFLEAGGRASGWEPQVCPRPPGEAPRWAS